MARNKHPEETVRLILDAASKLFIEKGYDGTSLQDIINETKLSKGAIYHHFSSKEEIFERICGQIGEANSARLAAIRDDPQLNGREKLKEIFRSSLLHPNQEAVLRIVPYLLDNPRFLAIEVHDLLNVVAPEFIQPILDEGAADGSIQVENTRAMAEVLLLMIDIWVNPMIQPSTPEEVRERCRVFISMTNAMGLDVMDEEMIEVFVNYSRMRNNSQE